MNCYLGSTVLWFEIHVVYSSYSFIYLFLFISLSCFSQGRGQPVAASTPYKAFSGEERWYPAAGRVYHSERVPLSASGFRRGIGPVWSDGCPVPRCGCIRLLHSQQ